MSTEFELKLAATKPDLDELERVLLDMSGSSACSRSYLTTTYYDTPDWVLRNQGLTLRVRGADGHFVQTVKTRNQAGALGRGEWEDEIAGAAPDLHAPRSGGQLPATVGDKLRPLFECTVTRRTIVLEPSPSLRVEAAIDEGHIRGLAGGGTAPISEIELELKRGKPGALFDTALTLLAAVPLHIETRSKADRGYAAIAATTTPPSPVHATPIALDPTMSTEAALQAIGGACLSQLFQNEAAALAGDAEGVHEMRVASRRLRAAVGAFGKLLPKPERDWLKGELNQLDKVLGPARNLDVFTADLLAPCRAAYPFELGLQCLTAAVEAARSAAHRRVRDLILSPQYTRTVLLLLRWFETRGWHGGQACSDVLVAPIADIVPQLLDRGYRKVSRRGKNFRKLTEKERHKLRIAVKELRYSGELFGSLFDSGDVQQFGKPIKALQAALGFTNDVCVARDVIAELSASAADKEAIETAGELVLDWQAHKVRRCRRDTRKQLRRLKSTERFWQSS